MINNRNGIAVVDLDQALQPLAVKAFFSTRSGGVSQGPYHALNLSVATGDEPKAVAENLRRLKEAAGSPSRWLTVKQVHGDRVLVDDGAANGLMGEADGLVTRFSDVALSTYHADCYPIYAVCGASGILGLAHAGWQGVYLEIAKRLVETMVAEGASRESIRIAIGPGIGPSVYEVSETLAKQFAERFGAEVVTGRLLNLPACIVKSLKASGIEQEQIAISGLCTLSNPELFFSHRRDGATTGRMMAVITR